MVVPVVGGGTRVPREGVTLDTEADIRLTTAPLVTPC